MKFHTRWAVTSLFVIAWAASSVANAALIDRGGGLIYDTDLNVTWLQNANLAATNSFGVSGINTASYAWSSNPGYMTWNTALSWVSAMNAANYLGYNDWRLPTLNLSVPYGCNFAYSGTDCGYNVITANSEMAHLFYVELGNKANYDTSGAVQPGWGLINTGPFSNLQAAYYWTGNGTGYTATDTTRAWDFGYYYGDQGANPRTFGFYAMVVRPGDVAAVPIPAAAWLFGSGLLGLIGVARRKAA